MNETNTNFEGLISRLIELSPVGVVVKTVADSRIVYHNALFKKLFEINHERIIGRKVYRSKQCRNYINQVIELDNLCICSGEPVSGNLKFPTSSGDMRTYYSNRMLLTVCKGQEGPLIVSFYVDITDQESTKLKLANALKADMLKSDFLSNMSHEIRTPLNAIVGFSEVLADEDDPYLKKKYVDIIQSNNHLLIDLINDILDFAKIESNKLNFVYSNTDVHHLCEEVYDVFSLKPKEGVSLQFNDQLPAIPVKTDCRRVIQILSNFLSNAFKFTDQGSIILYYALEGNEIVFHVEDTGSGLSEKECINVFDRYARINELKKGTGLGLTISKMLAERLGGRIGVTSQPGKGSDFWFTIPFTSETTIKTEFAEENEVLATPFLPVMRCKQLILVAEDHEDSYLLIESYVQGEYELVHARNGIEALELFETIQPDLLLLDIKMPKMDGLQVLKYIRKQNSDIPIIVMSAFAYSSEVYEARNLGTNEYLVKPINKSSLIRSIKKYLK